MINITPNDSESNTNDFNPILFKTNSFTIIETSELDKLILFLSENSNYVIRLTGYSDTTGETENNFKLAQKRAETVKKYLVKKGIKEHRIYTRTHGEISTSQARKVTIEIKEK